MVTLGEQVRGGGLLVDLSENIHVVIFSELEGGREEDTLNYRHSVVCCV